MNHGRRAFENYDNISFVYLLQKDMLVLKNISTTIEPDQLGALPGKSEAEKSTFAAMLLHLYQTTSGNIFSDNCSISAMIVTDLCRQIALSCTTTSNGLRNPALPE